MYGKWEIMLSSGYLAEKGRTIPITASKFEVIDGAAVFYGPVRVRDRKREQNIQAVYAPGAWLWAKEA